jgi:hypothetical protein
MRLSRPFNQGRQAQGVIDMYPRLLKRLLLAGAFALLALPMLAATASADQAFHTLHADLAAVRSAPLQSGFVNDIHTNGVQNGAHERYVLNGALPDTTFQVTIHLFLFDPTCSTAPLAVQTATVETNGNGNGEAKFEFPAGPPSPLAGFTHGILWQFSVGGTVVYQTACHPLTLD